MILPHDFAPPPAPVRGQEHDAEVAEFIRKKGVTRYPTAYALPTTGAAISEADKKVLAAYSKRREQEAQAKAERRARGFIRKRIREAEDFVLRMRPVVLAIRQREPAITLDQIACELNEAGYKSVRNKKWSGPAVRWVLDYQLPDE